MKTYTLSAILLMAAMTAAKELPDMDSKAPEYDESAEDKGLEGDLETEETWEQYWQKLEDRMLIMRLGWTGFYQGLYGIEYEDAAPTEDCFGKWIPEKMKEIHEFKEEVAANWMGVEMDHASAVAYDVVDLIFMNDKYCHFRSVLWDVYNFCLYSESCATDMIFDNMQKNAFNIITQVSSTASILKQDKWEDLDLHHKAYTVN